LSTPFLLQVPRSEYDALLAQALAERPNECCGLLAGHKREAATGQALGQVLRRYPLPNAAASPVEYLSDAQSMFEAIRDMRRLGLEVLAVYHSHPTSDPVPSRTDLERNYSPEVVNLIVSLRLEQPSVRAWWLTDEAYREAEWELVDDPLFGERGALAP
jgi:proteasome lid subunit RPN8/RPN11